jgi:hypothetical protein
VSHIKLFEAWLAEEAEVVKATQKDVSTVKDMLTMPYSKFVDILKDNAKDPKVQAVLNMGKKDGAPDDEEVKVNDNASFNVKDLQPTQSQIGFADSIGYLAKKDPAGAGKVAKGDTSGFNENRILTANGKYILDGHHRWSQVYAINPDAKIPAVDLTLPGLKEADLLKVIQAAIAATYQDVYKKPADAATDIFDEKKMPTDKMEEKIKAIIAEAPKGKEFVEVLQKAYEVDTPEEVITKLADNAKEIKGKKPKAAPAREYMPQPTDTALNVGRSEDKTKDFKGMPGEFIDKIQSGDLNFKAPLQKKRPNKD